MIDGLTTGDTLICIGLPSSGYWRDRFNFAVGDEVCVTAIDQRDSRERLTIIKRNGTKEVRISNTEKGWIQYFKRKDFYPMRNETITILYFGMELEIPLNTVAIATDASGKVYAYLTTKIHFNDVGYWSADKNKDFVQVGMSSAKISAAIAKISLRLVFNGEITERGDTKMSAETNSEDQFTFTTSHRVSVNEIFAGVNRDKPIGICRNVDTGQTMVAVDQSYIAAAPELPLIYRAQKAATFTVFFLESLKDLNPFLKVVRSINRSIGESSTYEVTITA